jgi:peptidyl-prolyl cis-trans isomerase SurA
VRLKFAGMALLILALMSTLLSPAIVRAQDGEARVIDEVIAQVNADVITLSMLKREMKEAVTALQQQGKTEQEATSEITSRQPEIIAGLINEQLLMQQGKELGLSEDVEAEVNRRMLEVARQQGIKTIEGLKEAMRASGFDYDSVRQTMRTEIMKQAVMSRDVDAKIFYGLSAEELKKYYESHKNEFKKPESVSLSEIFLSLAGKSEAEVKAKADQIIAQARAGADFGALAATNSERMQNGKLIAPETKGKVGLFEIPNLRDNIAAAIKDLKTGGVSEPIRYDEGFQILKVDERIAGSDTPIYNENRVREAITAERSDKERVTYMEKLRKDAYIKISPTYRASVTPFLGTGAAPASTSSNQSSAPSATANKSADKKSGDGKPKK